MLSHYLQHDLRPGHGTHFKIKLPERANIELLGDIKPEHTAINGLEMTKPKQGASVFTSDDMLDVIALPDESGFSAASISTATMIFDPLF